MTVSTLIKWLQKCPQEKQVAVFWDGNPRGEVEGMVNDDNEVVIVGDWSVYRDTRYKQSKIIFG